MKQTSTATIRQRGQLTLPQAIRKRLPWVKTDQPVTITTTGDKIVITPHQPEAEPDWDYIWEKIDQARSIKGKQGDLSHFIQKDRETRR